MSATWSAPVRYAEADQQGVVFNSHYLLYCDEAMGTFCAARGLHEFVELVRLKTSRLTWHAPARWGETLDVDVTCTKVGRTSATISFGVRVGERACCEVETIYVHADRDGIPQAIDQATRVRLLT
ncbi:MAG: acyl-CoA thioesterase [Jatrophihabitans sp.]